MSIPRATPLGRAKAVIRDNDHTAKWINVSLLVALVAQIEQQQRTIRRLRQKEKK